MKIILNTDLTKIGNKYDIKEFKDGYANILIAKGLAILATPNAISSIKRKIDENKLKKEEEMKIFNDIINKLTDKKIIIKVKSNEKGHLFKAVSPKDVVLAIKESLGIQIEENLVVVGHIKELGLHTIEIKKGDRKGNCEIIVEKL